jgi:DNA-binding GntR family transcriptional regulator
MIFDIFSACNRSRGLEPSLLLQRVGGGEVTDSNREAMAGLAREGPVTRRGVGEVVADHIRSLVFFGELRDGERVPQREIAEALGVSSVPVREALAALQREGVVTIEPNRGAFVNGLDADVVIEQFYLFGRIYGRATRVATERGDPDVIAALSDLAERIQAERDLDALLDLSIRFQNLIVEKGGSKRLRAIFTPLSRLVPGNFYVTIPGSAEVARRGVSEMAQAIASGQPDAAEQACWRLIDEIGELVARRFRERDRERP